VQQNPSSGTNIYPGGQETPRLYGNRTFITVFTTAHRSSRSWDRWTQSISTYLIHLRSILILSSHLRLGLPSSLFPAGFPANILTHISSPMCAICPAHLILLSSKLWLKCVNTLSWRLTGDVEIKVPGTWWKWPSSSFGRFASRRRRTRGDN